MPRWARSIAIPPPRLVPWTMKNVDSARTELRFLPDGRLHLHIRHDVLRGVTPASTSCPRRMRERPARPAGPPYSWFRSGTIFDVASGGASAAATGPCARFGSSRRARFVAFRSASRRACTTSARFASR